MTYLCIKPNFCFLSLLKTVSLFLFIQFDQMNESIRTFALNREGIFQEGIVDSKSATTTLIVWYQKSETRVFLHDAT